MAETFEQMAARLAVEYVTIPDLIRAVAKWQAEKDAEIARTLTLNGVHAHYYWIADTILKAVEEL